MDLFKGIELKLLALEQVLEYHSEWRGKLVLVQVSNPPRYITQLKVFSKMHPASRAHSRPEAGNAYCTFQRKPRYFWIT